EERSALSLLKGAFQSFSRKPRGFEVSTPYLNGSIEGTEFVFRVIENASELTVFEGTVVASNDQGSVPVSGGESVSARDGQAPQSRTVVRPRDAAQWSLYYPPVLAAGGQGKDVAAGLRQAANDLSVGRVDEALPRVNQAIEQGTDAGLAYALRAVINVVQNQPEQALADANQAVTLSSDSSAAKIALSYAQQASFQIPAARDTLLQAVAQQPGDALALARLAELQLMLGDKQQASEAAQKAAGLAPELGRTQITLGFTALSEFRAAAAQAAFEKAIALDSADPLPHLGLGLAKISQGELEQGRSDIEVAVGLGSNDALLRAYLGKAYFEEKRGPLDSEQFDIAKQLDPNDPTAFLYDGIAKQTQNRPVEAARDLEKSIDLNDNRASYRGRLLLDKDRAARGASLARVYKDLGFNQSGIVESTRSLGVDPANASAHRFLSDSHRDGTRRTEISRVSELLQAQMLQDLNINPVQPSISSTNLNIVTAGGPASAGFNEFTPLFEQNRTQFNASAVGGNHDTKGGEAVLSTVQGRFSGSIGGFGFESDGFRDNADTEHEIYNAFGQVALSPKVNLQAELGRRHTDYGDVAMHFDPDDFDPTLRTSLDDDTGRLGLRFSPNQNSTLLLSAIYADREGEKHQVQTVDFGGGFLVDFNIDGLLDEEVNQYDAAWIYQRETFNVTVGGAYADSDREDTFVLGEVGFPPDPPETDEIDTEDTRLYVYGNIMPSPRVIATVGISYQDYDHDQVSTFNDFSNFPVITQVSVATPFDFDEFNPKLGLRVAATDDVEFRAAYFEVVKPPLSSNRTLEPTQVAGFNQFFDDPNGTKSKRYGVGLDARLNPAFSYGVEFTKREVEWLINPSFGQPLFFEDRDEQTHRAYAYWTPTERLAVDLSLEYDRFENQDNSLVLDVTPTDVKTYSLPLSVKYFHPGGWFAGARATYVDQEVEAVETPAFPGAPTYRYQTGDSDFTVVDLMLGYRLPKRQGIVSLSVQNIFDEDFEYLDDSYRTFQDEPTAGPYLPELGIMGRVTLNF
ncbi:MAG: TonB-dependent receptor, partial [Gammaproteobacteria bacterium]|nr:TonB-dependent receptor [Gammaproteobacteria bacterium]